MTIKPSTANVPRNALRIGRGALFLALASALVSGCANMLPRNSSKQLAPVDDVTLPKAATQIAQESAMLQRTVDQLREQLQHTSAPRQIPAVQPVYDPLEDKVVSIRMYDASVGTLLWAMSDQLGMNLILDPKVQAIQKRATLNLNNVTAREVFNHILEAFDLHGEARGRTLYVNLTDERVYDLDFLNARLNVDISDGGNVFGANQGGSGGGGSSGGGSGGGASALQSNFSLAGGMTAKNGVYEEIENSLKSVLGDPAQAQGQGARQGDSEEDRDEARATSIFTLNPSSGTLFVRARPSEIRSVERMVNRYKSVMGRQVQIDAQLIDVQLNDGYQFGVDWNLLRKNVAGMIGDSPINVGSATRDYPGLSGQQMPPRSLTLPAQLIGNTVGRAVGFGYANDSFSVAVNMLRSYGTIKVLSNPSIRARNGAPAMLSVGTNIRYLSSTASTLTNPGGGATTVSTNAQTDSLFSGIMVGVVPFIREDGVVELLVHPMQSDVDPNSLQLVDAGGGSRVSLPVTSFKGMTTTLNIADGDTVMIGGLIDQKIGSTHAGVPGVSDIPGLGALFDKSSNTHNSRELVMVLRVRVL